MARLVPLILTLLVLVLPAGAEENIAWFETDTLNAGLGPVPDLIDRDTPRATLESLMTAARHESFEAAAHVLDLRDVPPGRQEEVGAELARKLDILIERRIRIDWNSVADRPDALDETLVSQNPLARQPRRSIRLWSLDLDGRPVSIRLNRIKPEGEEPVWVFSRQTVSNIAGLYAVYGPAGVEALLPRNLRERTRIGLLRWELLALPLLVLCATAAGWLVHRALMQDPEMLRIIKIKCAHDADVEALREVFLEIVKTLDPDELGDLSLAEVRVAGQDVFGIDVWFFLPCADPNTSWTLAAEAREEIMRRGTAIARERRAPIFPEVKPAEAA